MAPARASRSSGRSQRDDEAYGLTTGVGVHEARADRGEGHDRAARRAAPDRPGAAGAPRRRPCRRRCGSRTRSPGARPPHGRSSPSCSSARLNDGSPARGAERSARSGSRDLAPIADLADGLLDGFEPAARRGDRAAQPERVLRRAWARARRRRRAHPARRLDVAGALDVEAFGAARGRVRPGDRRRPAVLRASQRRSRAARGARSTAASAQRGTFRTRSSSGRFPAPPRRGARRASRSSRRQLDDRAQRASSRIRS